MSPDRFELARRNAQEVVLGEELEALLARGGRPKAYVGFEPSGLVHTGHIIVADKIRDLVDAGFEFTLFIADWHAFINDKFGSDIEKIRVCGKYFEDCFEALGVDRSRIKLVYADDLIQSKRYWESVLRISKSTSLARMKRAMTIMGRKEEDADLDSSKLIYPAMQVADIFEMDIDLALGGMDQRHAHMLMRDVAPKLGKKKAVALHTPLLTGLQGGGRMDFESKMSKSKPDSCIYIHDPPEEIKRKVNKAFCTPQQLDGNSVIEHWKYLIFNRHEEVRIERDERFGGPLTVKSFEELARLYSSEQLHSQDLKGATAHCIDELLAPVRKYFEARPDNYRAVRELTAGKK